MPVRKKDEKKCLKIKNHLENSFEELLRHPEVKVEGSYAVNVRGGVVQSPDSSSPGDTSALSMKVSSTNLDNN